MPNPLVTAFYKVVLNQLYAGQNIQNILYYRTGVDIMQGLFGLGGARELSEEVLQEIVPAYRAAMPTTWEMQSIIVYPYNNVFQPLYQMPYERNVHQFGLWTNLDATNGAAPCVNIKFNLEPVLFGTQALTAPKRGYISISPVNEQAIDNSGYLKSTVLGDPENVMNRIADAVSQNLESIDPPCIWFPIRAKVLVSAPGTGGSSVIAWSYADISGAAVHPRASFRRSRLSE